MAARGADFPTPKETKSMSEAYHALRQHADRPLADRCPPLAPTIWVRCRSRPWWRDMRPVDWNAVDDVVFGCANQAGEDNRNVARMAVLLAGLPKETPASTINRLCGFRHGRRGGRRWRHPRGEIEFGDCRRRRERRARRSSCRVDDTFRAATRCSTPPPAGASDLLMKQMYGTDAMPETAENVVAEYRFHARTRMPRSVPQARALAAQRSPSRSCRDDPREEG